MIPADDLHWVDGEGFTLLSLEEIRSVIKVCQKQDMSDGDIFKTVKWCESIRSGELLWKHILTENIRVCRFDNNEPVFCKNEN
jgi:hypothetical protein